MYYRHMGNHPFPTQLYTVFYEIGRFGGHIDEKLKNFGGDARFCRKNDEIGCNSKMVGFRHYKCIIDIWETTHSLPNSILPFTKSAVLGGNFDEKLKKIGGKCQFLP